MTSTIAAPGDGAKKNPPVGGAKKNGNPVAPVGGTTVTQHDAQEERIGKHAVHPLASLFPLITGDDYKALVEGIRVSGQNLAIVLDQNGLIVDGRNRYHALLDLGIEPKFETKAFESDAILSQYLISANLARRHLNAAQRAFLAARIQETLRPLALENKTAGVPPKMAGGDTRDKAAEQCSVGHTYVDTARKAIEADPKIEVLVKTGKVTTMAEVGQLARSDPKQRAKAIEELAKAPAKNSKKKTSPKKTSTKTSSSPKQQPSKSSSVAPQPKTDADVLGALEMAADFLCDAEENALDEFGKKVCNSSKLTADALDKLIEALSLIRDARVLMEEPKPKRKRKSTSRAARLDDAMDELNGLEVEKARDTAAAYLDALDGKSEWQGDPPAFYCSNENVQGAYGEVEQLYEEIDSWASGMEGTNRENTSKYDDLKECLDALEALKDALDSLEGLEILEIPPDPKDRDAWKSYADALSKLYDGIEDAVSAAGDVSFPGMCG
jgi:hypothetical protein